MPKIIETTVYTFDELSDDAKQTARDWYLSDGDQSTDAYEQVCEDAKNIGLEIECLSGRRANKGRFMQSPPEVIKAIMTEHGAMCDTYKTALRFLGEIQIAEKNAENDDEMAEINTEFLQALLKDYRAMWDTETAFQQSDEVIDENIIANEYTFTATGKRFG